MRYALGGIDGPGLTIDTEDLLRGEELARSDVTETIGALSPSRVLQRWGHFLASPLNAHVQVPFLACRRGGKRPRDDLIGHEQVGILDDHSDWAISGLTVVGREENCAFAKGFG